jgi:hypothetical protein
MVLDNVRVLLFGSAGVPREAQGMSYIEIFQQINFQLRQLVLAASPVLEVE